jgi:putative hemolysin
MDQAGDGSVFSRMLRALNVQYNVSDADVERIPTKGGLLVVANHPFGILDGVMLADILLRVRPDVKILTNRLLAQVPWLTAHCIFVDPFGTTESAYASSRGLREAIEWLKSGGALAVFPAGEVSHFKFSRPEVTDPDWSDTATRLARKMCLDILPVHFSGRNSVAFQALGLAHPRLQTLRLTHEFVNAKGKTIDVRIGSRITTGEIAQFKEGSDATHYMRWRTYFLRERGRHSDGVNIIRRSIEERHDAKSVPVAEAIRPERLIAEVNGLQSEARLCQSGEFAVYVAPADRIPSVLHEIGRLREITFRAASEGSGLDLDLDEYDQYYKHLFVWDTMQQRLVGAYRLGDTAHIVNVRGVGGLYTSTLFKYHREFFSKLGPALEMGRSFVRQEYQRQYAPLLMLWKGIGYYVAAHPQAPVLFGAVSMSNDYKQASRELLVRFFEREQANDPSGLASMVRPRCPFRGSLIRDWETNSAIKLLASADELNAPISDVEADGKGLPILVKQYLKVGGSILAFNVDRAFSNVLDGLVMVDLRKTRRNALNRYMTVQGAEAFLQYHRGPEGAKSTAFTFPLTSDLNPLKE